MIIPYKDRLIPEGSSLIDALETLNKLGSEPIAFVVTQDQKLIGSLTDGDIRRALLKGIKWTKLFNSIQFFYYPTR